MGSTGHSTYAESRTGNVNTSTFGIPRAINYTGRVPPNSGLEKPGNNKVTLKVPVNNGNNILFQFKLDRSAKLMTITGFRDGIPEVKAKVRVDAGVPSLDKVIKDGSRAEKLNATKLRNLFNQSTKVNENQLSSIANKLLEAKKKGS